VDFANGRTDEPMLTTADLAAREDFTLGGVIVSPSIRALRGPLGTEDVEPRVMQVLVVLADSAGQVVTRETLFNRCWGGVYVGDDSLNRAVAAVRRAVAAVGGRFEVETIPRTGYRLVVPKGETKPGGEEPLAELHAGPVPRRAALIGGAAAAASVLGGAGLWWATSSRTDRRFNGLMARGEQSLHDGEDIGRTIHLFEQAVAVRPRSAKAWGLLALSRFYRTAAADPKDSARAVDATESAARTALAIDAQEPNALLTMFELQGSTLNWATRDQRLRQIITIDPANAAAIGELVLLLQAAGLNRESWNWNERALGIEPLSVDFLSKRALKLWIAGRTSEADKVIDQVRALYPGDPGPWWVRFLILALTGRPRAAQAMLDPNPARLGSPDDVKLWRLCLAALDRRSEQNVARARDACFDAATTAGGDVAEAVMILSALGQVGWAFDVANGYLLSRGSIVRRGRPPPKLDPGDGGARINTQWLFTPPCAVMRSDPRFLALCEGLGLTDYWRSRGVRPDYLLSQR
jgi:DNA-binding winged helix-turn-helix (wHTH) protein